MPNSIPIFWLYIHKVYIRFFISFSFLANSLMTSMYIKWLIFSCDLQSLYPAVHFLRLLLIGIIAIKNSNGDSASPWNMPLRIFTTVKLFPPAVNSTLQISMVFSINCMTWSGIIIIIRVFHVFPGDWVTASLLTSLGLFSVFLQFSVMLLFGWSPLGRQLLNLIGPLIIL